MFDSSYFLRTKLYVVDEELLNPHKKQ